MFPRCLLILTCFLAAGPLTANDGVQFDVPIICSAKPVTPESPQPSTGIKIVEVIVPVSPRVDRSRRGEIEEFQFDVFWNRNVYPLADYAPKTRTTSAIDGPITVEQKSDRNHSLGLELKSGYSDIITGSASGQIGHKRSESKRYAEIPQHDILIASGTIHRGTGAFFRFHPSRTETLEGGRELVVAFRVPGSWRAGILQIDCVASGNKKVAGGLWSDPLRIRRSFVMPIYLEGDDQARQAATKLVRSQIKLRQAWDQQARRSRNSGVRIELDSLWGRKPAVPDSFADLIIQSGSLQLVDRYRQLISMDLRDASTNFIAARNQLEPLSR